MAIRLFEGAEHAAGYALFRPQYSTKIRDVIRAFMKKHSCSFDSMVDVACGSGQGTHFWTDSFKNCIGLDISKEQIKNAKEKFNSMGVKNVDFGVSSAENLPKHLKECDLVTIAQAWHWINADAFYKEADRVLKSPGVLAVYGYGIPYFKNSTKASNIVLHYHNVTLKDYWDPHRCHIVNKYSEVKLPYETAERHDLVQEWPVPLPHFISYLGTWSGYWAYKERHPESTVLSDVQKDLALALNVAEEDSVVDCSFPIFLDIGLKP
jgi:ubiquinone/menaquinone biosynthesis C-methylase UbiE